MQLPQIQIASPCSAEWSQMKGDDRVRFCGECRKNVFNLSELREEEAAELIEKHNGNLCVRLFRRADGTILTADCPRGLAALRQRLWRGWAGLAVLAASLLIGALNAFGMTGTAQGLNEFGSLQQLRQLLDSKQRPTMGKMRAPVMGLVLPAPPPPPAPQPPPGN